MYDVLTDDPVVHYFTSLYSTMRTSPFGAMEVLLIGIIIVIIVGAEHVRDLAVRLEAYFKK